MNWKNSAIVKGYFKLYEFVAHERLKSKDIDFREIHTLLVVVLSTGILMWGYAFLAANAISSPVPGIVGFFCALVHLLSPLLFRFTNNSYIPCNVLLAAGIIHQGTFAYHNGGFLSRILIWFAILPMLGGVICGKKGAITWTIVTTMATSVFFLLHLSGHSFPDLLTPKGMFLAQIFLAFGWIYLSSSIVIVYTELRKNTEKKLEQQSQQIDDLFRVLFHDLANPLGRVAIGVAIAKREVPEGNRGLEIAHQASESMLQITQNIRKMYSVRKGKSAPLELSLTPFNTAVDYVLNVYENDLQQKKIKIEYNFDQNKGLHLLVEPISFHNQVLSNIISNAIKFSPPETKIRINTYPLPSGQYQIEVKDNGIGIPKLLTAQLFDINKKTSRPGTHGEKGTGFGMHIIKSFVEMYGGELEVESVEGNNSDCGTTVRLTLKGEWKG